MKLSGSLGRTTLGDVLGALHRERATGVLELCERTGATAGRRHELHLVRGLVQGVDTELTTPRLGEILAREGFVASRIVYRLGAELVAAPDKRVGDLLVERGAVTPEVVSAALRYQLRARLDALFGLGEATLRFHVASRRRRDLDAVVPLSPHEFLHGRARLRDAKRRVVPPTRTSSFRGSTFVGSSAAPGSSGSSGSSRRSDSPPPPASGPVHRNPRADAFSVLGLDAGADRAAVQRAFRRLAARLHPDRFPAASAEEKARLMHRFAEVSAAYHRLVA